MTANRHEIVSLLDQIQDLVEKLRPELEADAELRNKLVSTSKQLTRTFQTSMDQAWEIFFQPHHLSVLQTALDAGWLHTIVDAGDSGVSADHLASTSRADASIVKRLMRVLIATGSIREVSRNMYAPAEISKLFTDPKMAAGLKHASHDYAVSVSKMPEYFAENGYQVADDVEKGVYAYARGMPFLRYMGQTPAAAQEFNLFMSATRAGKRFWADTFPIEKLKVNSEEDVLLVDMGGGNGHDLVDFSARQESLQLKGKLVLQELPRVIAQVPDDLKNLFNLQDHDFFTPQKEVHARVYYVSNVLHGWSDEDCITILTHVKDAMKAGYSTLLLNEIVLPDVGCSFWGAAFDVTMMAMVSGRNRTRQEWSHLLSTIAGLKVENIWSLEVNGGSIIEVIRME
ncbi:O-methyltransferase-domain-containing protein [Lophiotrema nucula]|uniref:O-methyltransferase-domain-containing protein n=1 Tax=Lophiotrema nucula TaxID=690887 RepID=A0A6A5ZGM2_9PLEO|nr:O-methyltransferase-domain-containing protein [Lophiotrema nucula]